MRAAGDRENRWALWWGERCGGGRAAKDLHIKGGRASDERDRTGEGDGSWWRGGGRGKGGRGGGRRRGFDEC